MTLSHTFVLNLKLERLCLAKKILKGCGSSARPKVNPKEFPSTHSALATTFHTRHFMTGSKRHRRRFLPVEVEGIPEELLQAGNEEQGSSSVHLPIKEASW